MNIFLFGGKGVGKSFAIDRALESLGLPASGFRTFFRGDRSLPDRRLIITNVKTSEELTAVSFFENTPDVNTEAFDFFGAAALAYYDDTAFILMDELGLFESGACAFRAAVFSSLDSQVPVLGVVRENAHFWLDALRSRPDTLLLQITYENRDRIPDEILKNLFK